MREGEVRWVFRTFEVSLSSYVVACNAARDDARSRHWVPMMRSVPTTLLVAIGAASALSPPLARAPARPARVSALRMQFAQPPDTSDPEIFPKGPDGETLITFRSLDNTGQAMIEMAVRARPCRTRALLCHAPPPRATAAR